MSLQVRCEYEKGYIRQPEFNQNEYEAPSPRLEEESFRSEQGRRLERRAIKWQIKFGSYDKAIKLIQDTQYLSDEYEHPLRKLLKTLCEAQKFELVFKVVRQFKETLPTACSYGLMPIFESYQNDQRDIRERFELFQEFQSLYKDLHYFSHPLLSLLEDFSQSKGVEVEDVIQQVNQFKAKFPETCERGLREICVAYQKETGGRLDARIKLMESFQTLLIDCSYHPLVGILKDSALEPALQLIKKYQNSLPEACQTGVGEMIRIYSKKLEFEVVENLMKQFKMPKDNLSHPLEDFFIFSIQSKSKEMLLEWVLSLKGRFPLACRSGVIGMVKAYVNAKRFDAALYFIQLFPDYFMSKHSVMKLLNKIKKFPPITCKNEAKEKAPVEQKKLQEAFQKNFPELFKEK